jgi:hypothetical protein
VRICEATVPCDASHPTRTRLSTTRIIVLSPTTRRVTHILRVFRCAGQAFALSRALTRSTRSPPARNTRRAEIGVPSLGYAPNHVAAVEHLGSRERRTFAVDMVNRCPNVGDAPIERNSKNWSGGPPRGAPMTSEPLPRRTRGKSPIRSPECGMQRARAAAASISASVHADGRGLAQSAPCSCWDPHARERPLRSWCRTCSHRPARWLRPPRNPTSSD